MYKPESSWGNNEEEARLAEARRQNLDAMFGEDSGALPPLTEADLNPGRAHRTEGLAKDPWGGDREVRKMAAQDEEYSRNQQRLVRERIDRMIPQKNHNNG